MNIRGERVIIFGDSLSKHAHDSSPEIWDANVGSARQSSAPGDLLASLLLEQGAQAARVNARVGRSAWNFWQREPVQQLIASDAAFRPTRVLVMLGTNDADSGVAPDKDREAFQAIKDQYTAMGAEVYAIGPFLSSIDAGKVEQTVQVMKSVFGMRFIDGRPLSQLAQRAGDGVHYTQVGARTLALALADAVMSKISPTSIWNTVGLGLLGIGAVVVGMYAIKKIRHGQLSDFVSEGGGGGTMLGDTVDIVNGRRHRGTTNELIRKGYKQIPCSSNLDESGLARCWAKKPIDVKGVELKAPRKKKASPERKALEAELDRLYRQGSYAGNTPEDNARIDAKIAEVRAKLNDPGLAGRAPKTGPNAAIDSRASNAFSHIDFAAREFPGAFGEEQAKWKQYMDEHPYDFAEADVAAMEKVARSVRQRAARMRKAQGMSGS